MWRYERGGIYKSLMGITEALELQALSLDKLWHIMDGSGPRVYGSYYA